MGNTQGKAIQPSPGHTQSENMTKPKHTQNESSLEQSKQGNGANEHTQETEVASEASRQQGHTGYRLDPAKKPQRSSIVKPHEQQSFGPASPPPRKALPKVPNQVSQQQTQNETRKESTRSHNDEQPQASKRQEIHSLRQNEIGQAQEAMEKYSDEGKKYQLVRFIGKGAYGAVYLAKDEQGTKVAVKHVVNAFTTETDARRLYREIKVMRHFVGHPNIIRLIDILPPKRNIETCGIYLVSELMETDLHRVIHSNQDLTSDHVSYFIYQLLCALKHLHSANVLHRDLKPSNLLVNADCSLKVCDFGLARETDVTLSTALTEYVVTRWYRAPEVLLSGGRYTEAIDVWSVGCILAELLLRRPLFPGKNHLHQLRLIMQLTGTPASDDLDFIVDEKAREFVLGGPRHAPQKLESLFPHIPGVVLDLLKRMLVFNPAKRITVQECLNHEFLKRVRDARKPYNEFDSVQVFRVGAKLSRLGKEELKEKFETILCQQQSFENNEESSEEDTDSEDEELGLRAEEQSGLEEQNEVTAKFYNSVDSGIDQQANTEYWGAAQRTLKRAVSQSQMTDSSSTEANAQSNSDRLTNILANIKDNQNTQGFASIPGGKLHGEGNHRLWAQSFNSDRSTGSTADSNDMVLETPANTTPTPLSAGARKFSFGRVSQGSQHSSGDRSGGSSPAPRTQPPNKPLPSIPGRHRNSNSIHPSPPKSPVQAVVNLTGGSYSDRGPCRASNFDGSHPDRNYHLRYAFGAPTHNTRSQMAIPRNQVNNNLNDTNFGEYTEEQYSFYRDAVELRGAYSERQQQSPTRMGSQRDTIEERNTEDEEDVLMQ